MAVSEPSEKNDGRKEDRRIFAEPPETLGHGGLRGVTGTRRSRRMRRSGPFAGKLKDFRSGDSGAHVYYIHDRVPVAPKLADLLWIHFQQHRDPVESCDWSRLNVRHFDCAP